jgi:hypothetical protein
MYIELRRIAPNSIGASCSGTASFSSITLGILRRILAAFLGRQKLQAVLLREPVYHGQSANGPLPVS